MLYYSYKIIDRSLTKALKGLLIGLCPVAYKILIGAFFIVFYEPLFPENYYSIERTYPSYKSDHRFDLGACSIVANNEGDVYLTNEFHNSIYKYTKSGNLISSYDLDTGLISRDSRNTPLSQVVNSEGNLYTSTYNSLYLFDKNLSLLSTTKTIDGPINYSDHYTHSLSISPNDEVYYANLHANDTYKYRIKSLDGNLDIPFNSIGEKYFLGFSYLDEDSFLVLFRDDSVNIEYSVLEKNGELNKIISQKVQNIYSFSVDSSKKIIFTVTREPEKRIIRVYDYEGNFIENHTYPEGDFTGTCNNKKGWVDSNGIFYLGGDSSATLKKISYQKNGLSIGETWGVDNYFSHFRNIYTNDKGVYISESGSNSVRVFDPYFYEVDQIKINLVQEALEDNGNTYYHDNTEVGKIDIHNKKTILHKFDGGFILGMTMDKDHLYVNNVENNAVYKISKTENEESIKINTPSDYILRDIALDNNDAIYINDNGTCIKDLNLKELFCSTDLPEIPPGNRILDFKFSNNNESIIFSTYVGIFEYHIQAESLNKIAGIGLLPNQVRRPHSISIDHANNKLYIADVGNNRIAVYRKVDRPDRSKAIIIAGGESSGNTLWDEAQANANHAFWTLANQGYTKANIQYLNHNTDLDLDGNGEPDDVDGVPSLANIKTALTEWAVQAVEGEPVEDIVLYMIGHGGDGTFELGGGEILSASQLNQWLDKLQAIMPGKVTVIYDGCQSGSFQQALGDGSSQRTVITSSRADQNAYFQDAISFSHLFWNQVFAGKTLSEAFQTTQTSISLAFPNQTPLMDSDGDGVTNTASDYAAVAQQAIGNGTVYSGTAPEIGSVSLTPVDAGESTSTIAVSDISDDKGVQSAWGVVTPPYADLTQLGTPVQNLPRFDLLKQDDGSYQGSFDGFEQPGTYQIAIYAQDSEGNTSLPAVETLNVIAPLGRKALLVAGVNIQGQFSPALQKQTDHAYSALTGQGYADSTNQSCSSGDSICYLSANSVGTSGVDRAISKEGLEDALTRWATESTSDFVVYLVGDVVDDQLRLSSTESVSLSELRQWLDQVQANIVGTLTVIHEGNGSGASVAAFGEAAGGTKRIAISSSAIGQGSVLPAGGDASFSRYFWGQIAQGGNVGEAFAAGAASLNRYQTPQINGNGNARTNEKSDRYQARFHHLGLGILLAANEPVIEQISLNTELNGGNNSPLWAEQIISLSTLQKVWVVIEPPEYDPITQQTGSLIEVPLQLNGQGRWETDYTGFARAGVYTVHYYAQDIHQRISSPRTSYITQTLGTDAYEADDDSFNTASFLSAITQYRQWHNFTDINDVDYLSFDADPARGRYTLKVDSTGSAADAAFTLYDATGNNIALGVAGSPSEYTIDALPSDSVELAYWTPAVAGRYTLKVHAAETPTTASLQNGYTVSIFPTDAPHDASISGFITNIDGAPIQGARIYTDENQLAFSDSEGYYTLSASLGNRSLTIEASGYPETGQQIKVTEAGQSNLDFTLSTPSTADSAKPAPVTPAIDIPVIQALKPITTYYPKTHTSPIVVQTLQINSPIGGAEFHGLTLQNSEQSIESSEAKAVRLYHDINQDGQIDQDDIQISDAQLFAKDDENINLTLPTPYLLLEGQQHIIVAYEFY